VLVLQSGGILFNGSLGDGRDLVKQCPTGATVELTGVCIPGGVPATSESVFRIMLNSIRDIRILKPPPRWTSDELNQLLFFTAGLGLLAVIVIILQRRQVKLFERRIEVRTSELSAANQQLRAEIAERKRIDLELRRSEERFSKAFRLIPVGMMIWRLDDRCFLDVNESFLRFFGLEREQVIGLAPRELGVLNGVETGELMERARSRDGFQPRELTTANAQGDLRTVSFSAELVEIDGRPCLIGAAMDVTERKRAEEELLRTLARERELNQLKSSFVSMVSHEFRTPLEVILSSSEILDRYSDRLTSERRDEQLRAIRKSVRCMSDLIEEVLLLGKFEASRMECNPSPMDLDSACRRLIGQIDSATNRRCPIHLCLPDSPRMVSADENLLDHILGNLLGNAVKYSSPGSPVALTVSAHGRFVEFRIEDHGCGIPVSDEARLFTAFYRGSNTGQIPGSGLGLVIVKRCVDLHGGSIRWESQVGRGTTFRVLLPLLPALTGSAGPIGGDSSLEPALDVRFLS
jgi:PAS domain S-box-containing protein